MINEVSINEVSISEVPINEVRINEVGETDRVETELITVRTGGRPTVTDITRETASFVSGRGDGLLHVFVPHATAGVAIIETGAGTDDDLLRAVDDLLPTDDRWRHRHGSRGHGRDHVMPAFISPSVTLPVIDGRIAFGTWQSVCLVDPNGDNPSRQVRISFLPG
jgi:secondary thiamine-phosphate synthase enzyme